MRSFLRRIVVFGVAAILASATAELVMRAYCYAPRVFDSTFGFIADESLSSHWNREGNGEGHWRARGVRSDPAPASGPPLLVLGDSLTEAMHVDDAQTYCSRLSVALARAGHPTAILNAGIAGVAIARYVALAEAYKATFHPHWTVVQLDSTDLTDAWALSDSHFVRSSPDGPLRVVAMTPMGQGGRLRQLVRRMRAQSALLQNAVLQLGALATDWTAWHPFHNGEAPPRESSLPASSSPVEEELSALVTAFDGRVTLLFIPAPDQPGHPDEASLEERAVMDACAKRGWSCPQLRPAFTAMTKLGRSPRGFANSGYDIGHFNIEGHATIAGVLERELERLRLNDLF